MAAITDFDSLKNEISAYTGRTDWTTERDGFIRLTESYFNRDLRHHRMLAKTTLTATAGDAYVDMPADFAQVESLTVVSGTRTVLEPTTNVSIESLFSDGATGVPTHFAVVGTQFRLARIPDSAYSLELIYYQEIPALSDSQTTNWLLTRFPDAYLFGSLLQAEPYLQNDARLQTWGLMFEAVMRGLEEDNDRVNWSGGPASATIDINVV
ncbi:MAG: phage adaptor protein [Candidatus Puniceispirillales bacterium]